MRTTLGRGNTLTRRHNLTDARHGAQPGVFRENWPQARLNAAAMTVVKSGVVFTFMFVTAVVSPFGRAAAAPPADCVVGLHGVTPYSPCWQSYVAGRKWLVDQVTAYKQQTGASLQAVSTDLMLSVCRSGMQQQDPSNAKAFAYGCADEMVSLKPAP